MKMNKIIVVIGSGGKTSTVINIAKQNKDKNVFVTTTTHIYPILPPLSREVLIDPDSDELKSAVKKGGIVCAGKSCKEGKITKLDDNVLYDTISLAELTVIEADGSRQMPLKLHNSFEPVMPKKYDLCIVTVGLSALGKEVSQAVHRYELNPKWKRNPHHKVGIDDIIYCIEDCISASKAEKDKILVLINQGDNTELKKSGHLIKERLEYKTIVLSLKNGDLISL